MNDVLDKIICADVLDGLKNIPDDFIHLIFTSPPYNVLARSGSYDNYNDDMRYKDYLLWLKEVFSLIYCKTVDGGRIAINIDSITNREEEDKDEEYIRAIYPHLYQIMKEIGWKFRTEICWTKNEAVGKKSAWGSWMSASNPVMRRNHEYILVWSKNKWKLDSEEKSDMSQPEFEKWTLSHWNIRPETKKLKDHPAPFPEELAKRVIKLFSFPSQIILDPFSGTGTTCLMAKYYNRYYIGIDNSEKYCEGARNRIEDRMDKKNQADLNEEIFQEKKKINRKKELNSSQIDF